MAQSGRNVLVTCRSTHCSHPVLHDLSGKSLGGAAIEGTATNCRSSVGAVVQSAAPVGRQCTSEEPFAFRMPRT